MECKKVYQHQRYEPEELQKAYTAYVKDLQSQQTDVQSGFGKGKGTWKKQTKDLKSS